MAVMRLNPVISPSPSTSVWTGHRCTAVTPSDSTEEFIGAGAAKAWRQSCHASLHSHVPSQREPHTLTDQEAE